MVTPVKNKLHAIYSKLISSIAFYPSIILTGFLLLAFAMLSLEDRNTTQWLLENASYLIIDNADTARSILSTMIGGLISMMVFSFSMVMMILNQASSNFSPRLLPGLVSDKRNQIVLGAYLGTIVYNIIVLMSVLPDGNEYTLNGFSILVGMVLAISCLVAFIYFIHTISSGIQINNILERIFKTTKQRIEDIIEQEKLDSFTTHSDGDRWEYYKSQNSGYYHGASLKGLLTGSQKNRINIKVVPHKGQYILPGVNLFAIDKEINEEALNALRSAFLISDSKDIDENYVLGIEQIVEVGIKAMSPGINDPGTAVMTIDYVTELLALRMQIDSKEIVHTGDEQFYIQFQNQGFGSMLYDLLAAYRQYCKHDIILMERIVKMLKYLSTQESKREEYYDMIRDQLDIVKEDIKEGINNSFDRNKLEDLINE